MRIPRIACAALATLIAAGLPGCTYKDQPSAPSTPPAANSPSGSDIAARHLALDRGRDSVQKMRVKIMSLGEALEPGTPSQVELTLYRKQRPDGGQVMLVEFVAPAQERDRDSLVTITPAGEVEGVRYVQSNDSFLITKGVTSEDALFGMTIQEMADGQPEKYNYAFKGEEKFGQWQVYKLEGVLKSGIESKFSRLILYLSKDNYTGVGAEFYDTRNALVRRLTVEKMEQVEGHWTRTEWTLENPVRARELKFETTQARYNQNLSDAIFTREHLKKIASR